ncbi:hypothetical protein RUND412_000672 [Rhizina undulata]
MEADTDVPEQYQDLLSRVKHGGSSSRWGRDILGITQELAEWNLSLQKSLDQMKIDSESRSRNGDGPAQKSALPRPSPSNYEHYFITPSCSRSDLSKVVFHSLLRLPVDPKFLNNVTLEWSDICALNEDQYVAIQDLLSDRNSRTTDPGEWVVAGLRREGDGTIAVVISFCGYEKLESSSCIFVPADEDECEEKQCHEEWYDAYDLAGSVSSSYIPGIERDYKGKQAVRYEQYNDHGGSSSIENMKDFGVSANISLESNSFYVPESPKDIPQNPFSSIPNSPRPASRQTHKTELLNIVSKATARGSETKWEAEQTWNAKNDSLGSSQASSQRPSTGYSIPEVTGRKQYEAGLHISAMMMQGLQLTQTGEFAKAATVYEVVLEEQCHSIGEEHAQTMKTMEILMELYSGLGRFYEQALMCDRLLAAQKKAFGEEKVETLELLANICTEKLGFGFAEANSFFKLHLRNRGYYAPPAHAYPLEQVGENGQSRQNVQEEQKGQKWQRGERGQTGQTEKVGQSGQKRQNEQNGKAQKGKSVNSGQGQNVENGQLKNGKSGNGQTSEGTYWVWK